MHFDVIVIGASAAGLYASELLAKSGWRVALFEKQPDLSPAPRTYIITPGLFRVLPDFDQGLVRQRVSCFQLNAGDAQSLVDLAVPDLVIDRSQLRESLAHRAEEAGVELHFNSQFFGLQGEEGLAEVVILGDGRENIVTADFLIGADGVDSQVREWAGLPKVKKVPLLQAEIQLPEGWPDEVCGIWFDAKNCDYFYWLIPDRQRKGVVGLITDPTDDIKLLLNTFLDRMGMKALGYQSGQAAFYTPGVSHETWRGKTRILLVGDAAGQVKVTTVGGCVTGLAGSKAVAEAVIQSRPYHQASRQLNTELYLHYFIRRLLHAMSGRDHHQLVEAINPGVRSFLGGKDRDQMRREFWKLVFLQPAFLPMGVKLFWRSRVKGQL